MFFIIIGVALAQVDFIQSQLIVEPRVVRGTSENIESYGYCAQFILLGHRQFRCGSSILTEEIILTAAHCLDFDSPESKAIVLVGANSYNDGRPFRIKASIVHKQYDPEKISNDIALGLLMGRISLGTNMYRVALSRTSPKRGTLATIAGWGLTNDKPQKKSDILRSTTQRVKSMNECRQIIGKLQLNTFCAGDRDSKQYPAWGDSGSALVTNNYLQIGIVSYKAPRHKSITVYTDVSRYRNWIRKYTTTIKCDNNTRQRFFKSLI